VIPLKQLHSQWIAAALSHYRSGDLATAKLHYLKVLEQDQSHADALNLLGCLLDDQGDLDEAIGLVTRATRSNPQAYPYHYNLANMLAKKGQVVAALTHYNEAIRLKADYAAAFNNKGMLLAKIGEVEAASSCFRQAIAINDKYPDPLYNLGALLSKSHHLEAAIQLFQSAIELKPSFSPYYLSLGNAYLKRQRLEQAITAYKTGLAIDRGNSKIGANLGAALMRIGRVDDAILAFRQALAIDPTDSFCHSNLILAASYTSADPALTHAECVIWDQKHGSTHVPQRKRYPNSRVRNRQLRIGYVSADFRRHAAAYWIEPLLLGHQGAADIKVYCYSNSPSDITDQTTQRIRTLADEWVECANLSDEQLDQRIQDDAIDFLVDLSGHTDGNRLLVFARQPAPLQVSWFGFPTPTGLSAIQYRFTDDILDPPNSSESHYSESLVRLPRFYAAFRPDDLTPDIGESAFSRNGYVTFASLNSLAKITTDMLETWAQILCSVPNSHMLLQAAGLESESLRERIRGSFARYGIDAKRVEFRGWTDLANFLNTGAVADMALDTFPFNGGVTTCHCLWMGLPVISMFGASAASRVGLDILSRADLEEFAAGSPKQYIEKAVSLALDHQKLAAMRSNMRTRIISGGLLDGEALAAKVENAYKDMWRIWCETRSGSEDCCVSDD
jgi:predicted O-linked N-acetylglucosamine transferase (SPINDLY family)